MSRCWCSREILQFGEADDFFVKGEDGVEFGDRCRFLHAEFAIAVGVPFLYADGFHMVVEEVDILSG